jgi:RNA polymerase sigma factor (sigma-70 family)
MNEWELLAAAAQGNEGAFETLVQRFFPMVRAAATRQVGDAHLAEEIAQSVFVLLWRKSGSLTPEVALAGWLLRTTRFVCRDALKQLNRRARREEEAASFAALRTEPARPPEPDAAPLVDEALFSLSRHEQVCVIARYFQDQSFREIGARARISEDAAQKRVSRGLEKMRAYLERRGVKVSAMAIPALLAGDLARAAPATLSALQSALHTQAPSSPAWALAERFLRRAMLRAVGWAAGSVGVGLAVVVTVAAVRRDPAPPGLAPFRVSEPNLETVGQAWAQVVQRAAALLTGFPAPPAPGDPRFQVYQQQYTSVINDTTRVSSQLDALLRTGNDRARFAEFLTVELREVLALDPRQCTDVFARLREPISQGPTLRDGLRLLLARKAAVAAAIRQQLSRDQRQRWDRNYGADDRGFLTMVMLICAQP